MARRVAGLSYGGFLAAALALHAPERVSKAVLLCPAAVLAPIRPMFLIRAILPMMTKARYFIRNYWKWFLYRKEL